MCLPSAFPLGLYHHLTELWKSLNLYLQVYTSRPSLYCIHFFIVCLYKLSLLLVDRNFVFLVGPNS